MGAARYLVDVTIPFQLLNKSIKDSWFVSFFHPCAYNKCKIVDTVLRGQQNLGKIGIGAARCTIPYSNRSESIKDSWFIYFSTHDSTTNAKSLTPLFSGLL